MTYVKIKIPVASHREAKKWAKANIGPCKPPGALHMWDMQWFCNKQFYFKNPEHAAWFVLRWS